MRSRLIVHVDDYGVTENYSRNVLEAIERNVVDSISILPNGQYFETSMKMLEPYLTRVKVSVHLNLVEGFPLSKDSSLLILSSGEFKLGFLNLILFPLLHSKIKVLNFRTQIKKELKLQIEMVLQSMPAGSVVSLDSHRHIHLIPFLFDIVVELAEEYQLSKIRIIDEPFYLCIKPLKNAKAYLNGNVFKHFIIKFLSLLATLKLNALEKNKFHDKNEKFLGILFSDLMAVSNIKKGLSCLQGYTVRVLLHSGVMLPNESYNGSNIAFSSYYQSINRINERNEILSDDFQHLYIQINKS